jgi:hypothetical protein
MGALAARPEVKGGAWWISPGVGQNEHRSWPWAALGDLGLALADEWVTRYVLALGPNL